MVNMVVCGLGNISQRVSSGCMVSESMKLYGFMSSDINKAYAYKEKFNANMAYDRIEDVYLDDKAELLYFCTPNYLHYSQIKDALMHHKHVICEKPMVLEKQELSELFELAKKQNVFLMEAHKTAFSPLLEKVSRMIDEGIIGDVYYIEAEYSHDIREDGIPKEHWVFNESGGCSRDIGVYPICFANFFAKSKISSHFSVKSSYLDYRCDFFFQSLIEYDNGMKASVKSSWLYDVDQKGSGYIYGTQGFIKIPAYWKGRKAYLVKNGEETLIEVDFESDFTGEIEHAAKCILAHKNESEIMSCKASMDILEILG